METEKKVAGADLAGLIIIVLILLYFPSNMIAQHSEDVQANSYYTPM